MNEFQISYRAMHKFFKSHRSVYSPSHVIAPAPPTQQHNYILVLSMSSEQSPVKQLTVSAPTFATLTCTVKLLNHTYMHTYAYEALLVCTFP